MEANTDALSTAPITDNSADEQLTGDEQADQQAVEQAEHVESVDAPQAAEEAGNQGPLTRSERREQNYIDKLSEQIRHSHLTTRPTSDESRTRSDEYQPIKYEEGDYDADQLAADREAYGRSQYQQAIRESQAAITPVKQELWAQQLEFDNERVQKMWDILDETNEKAFDPDFSSEMTQKYLNFIGYRQDPRTGAVDIDRPNIRWVDFVRAEKQNLDRYVERSQAISTQNIVKQASNTGIRPSGQSRPTSGRASVDTNDPNWISKLSQKEWQDWGRDLADEILDQRLGIRR